MKNFGIMCQLVKMYHIKQKLKLKIMENNKGGSNMFRLVFKAATVMFGGLIAAAVGKVVAMVGYAIWKAPINTFVKAEQEI